MARASWRGSFPLRHKVDAGEALAELKRLNCELDGLRPREVVDAARDESSALHLAFEWDDSKAAQGYRIAQARMLIRAVQVEIVNTGEMEPVFISVEVAEDGRKYLEMSALISQPDLYDSARQMLEKKLNELAHALEQLKRYAPPAELAKYEKLQSAVKELIEE